MTLVIFAGVAKNLKKIFGVLTVRSPLSETEYKQLWQQLDALNEFGRLEKLRLFSMDGEDRNGEVCLVLYEEIGGEDMMLLFFKAQECCEKFGILQPVIQFRYEGIVTEENPG